MFVVNSGTQPQMGFARYEGKSKMKIKIYSTLMAVANQFANNEITLPTMLKWKHHEPPWLVIDILPSIIAIKNKNSILNLLKTEIVELSEKEVKNRKTKYRKMWL